MQNGKLVRRVIIVLLLLSMPYLAIEFIGNLWAAGFRGEYQRVYLWRTYICLGALAAAVGGIVVAANWARCCRLVQFLRRR